MRVCGLCKAAENPNGKLRFLDGPSGALCEPCFTRTVGDPSSFAQGNISGLEDNFVVIKCPDCRGSGRAAGVQAKPCESCIRYGYVRVAKNALPVYVMKPPTED